LIAVVLAGGQATRLYPTTMLMPKHLIMINGYPVIKYVVDHCKLHGITIMAICVSSDEMAEEFRHALEGKVEGMQIAYAVKPPGVSTAGRIKHAMEFFDKAKDFVVYYGDILTYFDLAAMIQQHEDREAAITLATTGDKELEFGAVLTADVDSNRITALIEHPALRKVSTWRANVGIAVCNRDVLEWCNDERDFFGDVVPKVIVASKRVFEYQISNFIDIGTFSAIQKAGDVLRGRRN